MAPIFPGRFKPLMNPVLFSRRQFLGTTAAGLLIPKAQAAEPFELSFFVLGDTHYLANKDTPVELDPVSAEINAGLVRTVNELRGTAIPDVARAGSVGEPRGVIHVGDLIDTGDKSGPVFDTMKITELSHWQAAYGLNGEGGTLKYPVYEILGNHDAPHGDGLVRERLFERNKTRTGLTKLSANGLHYSWDWGPVHCVCLGLIVGEDQSVVRKRRFAALDSLEFLVEDLAEHVGDSGRPVVLVHHVDVARYGLPPEVPGPFEGKEWDPADVSAYYRTIRGYKIAAIFYGHTHTRNVFRWDGVNPKAETGLPVFNCDNSGHFKFDDQAFFHVTINERELLVREYKTTDRWQTGAWTPMSWSIPLA